MTWVELFELAGPGRSEPLVLDMCLDALRESNDVALQAEVVASVPGVVSLCGALDQHGIAVPSHVETQVVVAYRLASAY